MKEQPTYRWTDEDMLLWEKARGTLPPDESLGTEWLSGEVPSKRGAGAYEAPAIIYEGEITTRAGSKPGGPPPKDVDPATLFGNVD